MRMSWKLAYLSFHVTFTCDLKYVSSWNYVHIKASNKMET